MYPVLFKEGPFVVYTHDFFTLVSILVGLALYYRELQQYNMFCNEIFWISVAAVMGGAIGSRLITAWEHPAYYTTIAEVPFSYFIAHSGKGIIGGITGGYLAITLSKRVFGYTRSTGDFYAAPLALAMGIGRVGCFLSELPLGKPTNLPWGIRINALESACLYCGQTMHPSMLYEIIFHLFAYLLILRFRHYVIVQGDTLKLYLLASSIFRFLVEFLRANTEQFWGLTGPQIDLVPLTLLLIYHFLRQWKCGVYQMPPVLQVAHTRENFTIVNSFLEKQENS